MKKIGNWLWGCILIVLGVIWGINALGIAQINVFFPGWWTLFIIVPCLIGLFTDEDKRGYIGGLVVGVLLLLSCWDVISFSLLWKLICPVILVGIGVCLLVRNFTNNRVQNKINAAKRKHRGERRNGKKVVEAEIVEDGETTAKKKSANLDEDTADGHEFYEYWSTFGDQKVDFDGKDFRDCRVDAIFGSAVIDLREAKIVDEAILHTTSIFGNIKVKVPEEVKVETASMAIFGGVNDQRDKQAKKTKDKDAKTLYIEATCVFGGVEVQ